MYLIVVKFRPKPEYVETWPQVVSDFTAATRKEPGNLWFEWARGVEDTHTYYLIEAFTDDGAEPHVTSAHFTQGLEAMRPHLSATPQIISRQVDGDGWEEMGELQID